MDIEIDHYAVLGLPSGEQGSKLSQQEIKKAYFAKSLVLHPDKRPDDPNAHENFQKLKTSYEILKDEKGRLAFDDLLRVKREKALRQSQHSTKRRKMMSDLEERERAAFASESGGKDRDEEERIVRKLREEIARIRAMNANRGGMPDVSGKKGDAKRKDSSSSGSYGGGLDKERVLKVTWDRIGGEDYSAERLRELFREFGEVEDVVIRTSSRKKGSALVVMASKDAVVTTTRTVLGDLQNPLLVVPLQPPVAPTFTSPPEPVESNTPDLSNLVGAGFQAFEDSVLAKLRKAKR
ncbi:uncharacterized protein LOC141671949 [Apium graveolens]|uniref:uncharacterized protein LOC141671949 n=1 Tax=Apium graveolens TaxID=4045 RepID=UPI003D795461